MRTERRNRLFDALDAVSELGEADWPVKIRGPRRVRDRELEKVVEGLLARRQEVADELGLEASVLGSRASLEAHATGDSSRLMGWQLSVMSLS